MKVNQLDWLRDRGGLGMSKVPGGRRERVVISVKPVPTVPMGAVRPEPGLAAMADLTRGTGHDQGLSGVRDWSPPA